jgi:hypothetical protein
MVGARPARRFSWSEGSSIGHRLRCAYWLLDFYEIGCHADQDVVSRGEEQLNTLNWAQGR